MADAEKKAQEELRRQRRKLKIRASGENRIRVVTGEQKDWKTPVVLAVEEVYKAEHSRSEAPSENQKPLVDSQETEKPFDSNNTAQEQTPPQPLSPQLPNPLSPHGHYSGRLTFEEETDDNLGLLSALTPELLAQTPATSTPPTRKSKSSFFAIMRRLVCLAMALSLALLTRLVWVAEKTGVAWENESWQGQLVSAFASPKGYIDFHDVALLWPWITFEIAVNLYMFLSTKEPNSEPMGLLDMMVGAMKGYMYIKEVWADFALFMFSFVITFELLGCVI